MIRYFRLTVPGSHATGFRQLVIYAAALFILTVSGCAGGVFKAPPEPSGIVGRVTFEGSGFAGAEVRVYRSLADFRDGGALVASTRTGDGGGFFLPLKQGSYYLSALGISTSPAKGELFNFYGSNPVTVTFSERRTVTLSLSPVTPSPVYTDGSPEEGAGLEGSVTFAGEPLPEAFVYLYLGDGKDFKSTAYAVSPPTDENGSFSFYNMVDTSYWVIVRKRAGNRRAGPLGPGDYYGFYAHNPVRLTDGKRAGIVVETIVKSEDAESGGKGPTAMRTRLEGTVIDTAGMPVKGLYAFVYPDRIMSHAKPLAISETTGADGRFVLSLEKGGVYFLGAREHYGGNPRPGEYYGKYTGSADHSIVVVEGEKARDIRIVVERILE